MLAQDWLRLRQSRAAILSTGLRRDRRRRRSSDLGSGLPRPEGLEDRTLLTSPTVTTTAATGVTSSVATLNGTVNPNDNTVATAFEYGTNPDLAPNIVTTLAGTAGTPGSADGTGSAASFSSPEGVAVDTANGDIFVADTANDTIRMITPAGVVTTLAGTAGTPGSTDGTGAAALFNHPTGVTVDPATGNLYVSDTGNNTIRQVTSAGVVTTLAGTAGTSGSTDGTGAAALFNDPTGITFDSTTGDLFVGDTGNDTIRQIAEGGVVTTLAGTAGTSGSTDGTGAAARFSAPTGVTVDPTTGNIYVTDTANDTIRQVTSAGVVTTLAGTAGTSGSTDGTGAAASFDAPRGISEDPTTGFLYVADTGNDTIRLIAPGAVVTTLAGTAETSGSADGTGSAASFSSPFGVTFNSVSDTVYVADTGNETIRQLSLATIAAQSGLTGDTAQSIDAGVTGLSPTTTYYFRAVASTGTPPNTDGSILSFTTPAVQVAPTATTEAATSVTATGATLNSSVNPQGADTTVQFIYGTDPTLTTGTTTVPATPISAGSGTSDEPIDEPITGLSPDTTYYFEVAATNSGGTTDGDILSFTTPAITPTVTTTAATGVTSTGATLNGTVNPNGGTASTSFEYGTNPDLAPNIVTTLAGTAGTPGSTDGTGSAASFSSPEGVAVDTANGDIFVADTNNDTIREITPAGVVTTLAGTAGTSGSTDGTGAAALFNHPTALTVDPATGNVYVVDSGNDTIRQITPAGVVTTLAGTAGTSGSTDGTGAAALFNDPQGIAFDTATSDLFVSDSGNDTIRQVTSIGVVTTLAGTAGTPGSTDGTGAAARFNDPTGLAVDPTTGNIYVSDTANDTIRQVTSAGVVTTLAGTAGTSGSADGTGAAASFDAPRGISEDPTTGFLYVADTGNDTIRLIAPGAVVTTLAGAAGTGGSADGTGSAASFEVPYGVTFNSASDTAYVGDTGNDTIRQLSLMTVAAQSGLTGSTAQGIDAAVTGLSPTTTYYFRAVATDSGDPTPTDGSILSFTTPAVQVAPTATTQAATSVTSSGATLNASVNPQGADTTVQFIYGTDPTLTTGTTTVPATPIPAGSGTSDEPIDEPITGLSPSTTYYFEVAATNSGGTTDGDILSFTTPAVQVAPTATTQAATSVASTSATLNAGVNPQGGDTTVQFIYGTDPTLTTGTTTVPVPALTVGSGTSDVPVAEPITGLSPSTTYYFEVVATNSGGTTDGDILSFTTPAQTVVTPIITVGQATNVTSTGATVNATVNPNGVATTVHFVYGTTPTLASGTTTTADQSIGSGTGAVPVTAALTGLQPGTTYYFEAVAASSGVTTPGPIQSFTTAAAAAGPLVTNLQRFGYHTQPTEFVLTFNEPLNATSAQDVNNYTIVAMSGSLAGSTIPIARAVYDATDDTVTLTTVDRVYLYATYQITVNGTSPSGLSNTSGQFLQGQGSGHPGTNYVQTFGESILAGPDVTAAMNKATRARILKAWPHERAYAARIAASLAKVDHRQAAVRVAHPITTAATVQSSRTDPDAAAVDAVLGTIDVSPKKQHSGQ